MARSIVDIKSDITTSYMTNDTIAGAYGFAVGADFDSIFSKVSLESILFFIVATSIWTLESLFDAHNAEMKNLIDTKKPHRLKWYRDKALSFQFGRALLPDMDVYDQIVESEMVVKYASVVEYNGKIFIKVAKGNSVKEPLSDNEKTALEAYFAEVKDGGVVLEIINLNSDHFAIDIDVYYDPMVFAATGLRLDNGLDTVRDTIKDYVQNQIPFNGEYRNAALVDVLQTLDGVVIPELKLTRTVTDADFSSNLIPWKSIAAKNLPASGYYKVYNDIDLAINFIAYQTIESV